MKDYQLLYPKASKLPVVAVTLLKTPTKTFATSGILDL